MSKWEFLCGSKNLITNISIHSKHHPKATVINMKPLRYQGRTTVSKRKAFIYTFRCSRSIISSDGDPLISGSESILQQFRSYHQEITHSGQSPWQMYGRSKETAKSFGSEVSPLLTAAPLSQQLHNKQSTLVRYSLPRHESTRRVSQCSHEERSPYESRHSTSFCYQDSWDHGLMSILRLIQNTRKPQKWRTLCLKTPSHVAYGRKSVLSLMEWWWKPRF